MARGGSRPGAGRPRKPVEQHLAEGTYRPSRHRPLIAPPLLPPPGRKRSPTARWRELIGERHWRFSPRQLELARHGPLELFSTDDAGSAEAVAADAAWRDWDKRHGLRWRLQNECPRWPDSDALARDNGHDELDDQELVALVDQHLAAWDASLPDPPGWERLSTRAAPSPGRSNRRLLRVGCGNCGAKLNLLPASVAATVPNKTLPQLRQALAQLHDHDSHHYALADDNNHFPCPRCGEDQYAGS
jgi:hypothetical protein